jgi:hypothetical protein
MIQQIKGEQQVKTLTGCPMRDVLKVVGQIEQSNHDW